MADEYIGSREYIENPLNHNDSTPDNKTLYYSLLDTKTNNDATLYMTPEEVSAFNSSQFIDFPYNCINLYRINYTSNNELELVELCPRNLLNQADSINMKTILSDFRKVYEMADYIMISQPVDLIGWYNITEKKLKEVLRQIKNQYGLFNFPEDTGGYKFDRRANRWLRSNEIEELLTQFPNPRQIDFNGKPVVIEKKLSFLERIKLWFQNFWTKLKTTIINWGQKLRDFFEEGISTIKGWIGTQTTNWGAFWSAIKNATSLDSNATPEAKQAARQKIKDALANIIQNAFSSSTVTVTYEGGTEQTTGSAQIIDNIDLEQEVTAAINNVNINGFYNASIDSIFTDININQLSENNLLITETGSVSNKAIFVYDIKKVVPHVNSLQTYAVVDNPSNSDIYTEDTLGPNDCRYFYLAVAKGKKIKVQTTDKLIQFNDWEVPSIIINKNNDIYSDNNSLISNNIKYYNIKEGINTDKVLVTNNEKQVLYVLIKREELVNSSAKVEENKFYCSWMINNNFIINNIENNINNKIFAYFTQKVSFLPEGVTIENGGDELTEQVYEVQEENESHEEITTYYIRTTHPNETVSYTPLNDLISFSPNQPIDFEYNFDKVSNIVQTFVLNSDSAPDYFIYNGNSIKYLLSFWREPIYEQDYAQNGIMYAKFTYNNSELINSI